MGSYTLLPGPQSPVQAQQKIDAENTKIPLPQKLTWYCFQQTKKLPLIVARHVSRRRSFQLLLALSVLLCVLALYWLHSQPDLYTPSSSLSRARSSIARHSDVFAGPTKIAFLFLARCDLPLDFLWESFFENADSGGGLNFSIYIHSAPGFVFDESTTRSSFFHGRQLPNNIQNQEERGVMEAAATGKQRNGRATREIVEENEKKSKKKVLVIMGPTGSGKSKLAVDLASQFPIEVINADSMQVYEGLDVLTNKLSLPDQKGVRHHLLGSVSPNVEFTAKDFRDSAIPLIDDILSRNCLPVIVGGTNYYIQALVSPFLLDDTLEDMDESFSVDHPGSGQQENSLASEVDNSSYSYEDLKVIDPIAANRIHPNNHRKISQYLSMYAHRGVLPSNVLQGKAAKNWGRVDNFRYNCCFLCMDASLPVLDRFVDERVDSMIDAGLLNEVYEIFTRNADYTRGVRQAIGVREFESFLNFSISEASDEGNHSTDGSMPFNSVDPERENGKMEHIFNSLTDSRPKAVLKEAIKKVKLNTRRLLRRQKRRISRLETLFGWNIHFLDATESILCKSDDRWAVDVVGPAVELIKAFLSQDATLVPHLDELNSTEFNMIQRDLWTQHTCKACGDKILRGAHEWEQHKQGRGHRKRISRLKKSREYICQLA